MTVETITECLRQSVAGDPWHGPSIDALLADVTAEQAVRRPIAGAHSIIELVLHMKAWTVEVSSRLRGAVPGLPAEGDWPSPVADTAAAWSAARRDLSAAHAALLDLVHRCEAGRLSEFVGTARERALGTGVTVAAMLLGGAQHAAYHGGQIALLKRALAALGEGGERS